jgi:AcrR family transcriptional regulator
MSIGETAARRTRPGPRRSLSDEEILAAALRLLDRGGAAAVSVRSVAAEVGVAPNALYTYFPTKAALIRALVDGLLGGVDHHALVDAGLPWRVRLTRFALEVRELLLAHPGSVPLLLSSPFDGPNALTLGERLLDALVDAGISAADAARASYLLMTYVLGTVALDVAELEPGAAPLDETARTAMRRAGLTQVPVASLPRTAAAADIIAAYNNTDQYLWGLERLLDGLLVMAHPGHASPR